MTTLMIMSNYVNLHLDIGGLTHIYRLSCFGFSHDPKDCIPQDRLTLSMKIKVFLFFYNICTALKILELRPL